MLSTWRRTLGQGLRRRTVAVLALGSYLAAAFGLPVSLSPAKSARQPFPCQNQPCGCRSAEECWQHCCCYTPEERWAWARAHHVQPPAYAEPPTAAGWRTSREGDAECACCAQKRQARPPSCCQTAASKEKRRTPLRWPVGVSPLPCRGGSSAWVSAGAVLPPPRPLVWQPWLAPLGWISSADPFAAEFALIPPDPPPRCYSV
jgi:hypothetical protein